MKYREYVCTLCGFVYNEQQGFPEQGIAPGTLFTTLATEDPRSALFTREEKNSVLPEDWLCPDCAAMKDSFFEKFLTA